MPQQIVFTVVQDDLGHIVIDVATPFKWITKRAIQDSLRLEGPDFVLGEQERSLTDDLDVCPRAKLLAERFEQEEWGCGWIEVFWDGLEIFVASGASVCVEKLCDQLWGAIRDIAADTWSGKPPVRKDALGLFPRSLGKPSVATSNF